MNIYLLKLTQVTFVSVPTTGSQWHGAANRAACRKKEETKACSEAGFRGHSAT